MSMSFTGQPPDVATRVFDRTCLDLSILVGHEVALYAEQQPGRPFRCRVVATSDGMLSLDGGTTDRPISGLVPKQTVIVRFPYKGQDVCVLGRLRRQPTGRSLVILSDRAIPLSRRMFRRLPVNYAVRLAVAPPDITQHDLSRLRWMETSTVNLSAGGTLIDLTGLLQDQSYLFLSIDPDDRSFPSLVLGQVRHTYQLVNNHFAVGLEFLVRELIERHLPATVVNRLPAPVLRYSTTDRSEFNGRLTARMQQDPDS